MQRPLARTWLCGDVSRPERWIFLRFYGWNKIDLFVAAWRAAGLRIVRHIVFRKAYASSVRFMRYLTYVAAAVVALSFIFRFRRTPHYPG